MPSRRGAVRLAPLDGLRGIAVVAVLLFHGGVAWMGGGFLGVDAFFVLSGFLITGLLLEEWRTTGRLDLGRFFARRARRLLPALVLLVLAVCAWAAWWAPPDQLASVRADALAALGYVANWRFVFTSSNYFAQAALPSPLQHTWSLAIEEQFYLVWPLVVLLLARARRGIRRGEAVRRRVLAVALAGAAASALAMARVSTAGTLTGRAYYGTDTRAQALLLGAAAACLVPPRCWRGEAWAGSSTMARGLTAVGGLAAVAFLAACVRARGTASWLGYGGLGLVCLAVAAVVLVVVAVPASPLARALSFRPLCAVGAVSYGLYLWHWPVNLVVDGQRTGLTGAPLLAVRLAVTAALAGASYVLVERPVRLHAWRPLTTLGAVPVALLAVAGLVVVTTARTTAPALAGPVVLSGSPEAPATAPPGPEATTPPTAPSPAADDAAPGATTAPAPTTAARRPPHEPVKVLLEGDSVALTLGQGLEGPLDQAGGIDLANRAVLGCGVVRGGPYRYFGSVDDQPPECEDWPQRWAQDVQDTDPDVAVVLVGRWEVMDRLHDGTWMRIGDPAYDAYVVDELNQAVDVLGAQGAAVVLSTAPYYHRGERPDGGTWPEDDPPRVDHFNALVRQVAAAHPGVVTLVDLGGRMTPNGKYQRVVDGVSVRNSDGVHVSAQGARWLAPWLLPQWRHAAGAP